MFTILTWRLLKFAGLIVFAGGLVGLSQVHARPERLRMLYRWVVPGWAATWIGGWMLMHDLGFGPSEPWILAAIALSLATVHLAFSATFKARVHPATPGLALGTLLATMAVMVLRSFPAGILAMAAVGAVLVGSVVAGKGAKVELPSDPQDAPLALLGFRVVAWLEGLTLLILLGVMIPLRRLAGVELDGGTGVVGWIHGLLFLLYIQSIWSTSRLLGWSKKTVVMGLIAALLPGGTFIFERRLPAAAASGE